MLSPVSGWEEKSVVWSSELLPDSPRLCQEGEPRAEPRAKPRAKWEPCRISELSDSCDRSDSFSSASAHFGMGDAAGTAPLRAELPVWWVVRILGTLQNNLIWIRVQRKKPLQEILNYWEYAELGKAVLKNRPWREVIHHRSIWSPSWEIFHLTPFCTLILHSIEIHPNMSTTYRKNSPSESSSLVRLQSWRDLGECSYSSPY